MFGGCYSENCIHREEFTSRSNSSGLLFFSLYSNQPTFSKALKGGVPPNHGDRPRCGRSSLPESDTALALCVTIGRESKVLKAREGSVRVVSIAPPMEQWTDGDVFTWGSLGVFSGGLVDLVGGPSGDLKTMFVQLRSWICRVPTVVTQTNGIDWPGHVRRPSGFLVFAPWRKHGTCTSECVFGVWTCY